MKIYRQTNHVTYWSNRQSRSFNFKYNVIYKIFPQTFGKSTTQIIDVTRPRSITKFIVRRWLFTCSRLTSHFLFYPHFAFDQFNIHPYIHAPTCRLAPMKPSIVWLFVQTSYSLCLYEGGHIWCVCMCRCFVRAFFGCSMLTMFWPQLHNNYS